ncbi:hypothetical protein C3F09_06920 [candidate division GN15 bacterium]|uniref:Protein BatD n=1 Tax=candidate division GN15 bacterium TaxID=2072418 RepID=A0A855X0H8_9BACT|nr:MAG: hypothetical protein C3F09_06920 [candidate division GN15 bacterium]
MRSLRAICVIVIALVAAAGVAYAQPKVDTVKSIPGIEIKSSVDMAEAYIGDLITYQITITCDSTIQLVPPPIGANLGEFDVKDYQADVETKLKDGRVQNQTTFVLSTFTTGDHIIPPLPIMFIMPDSMRRVMLAEAIPIKIKSLLANAGDSVDIKPLKGPYQFKRNYVPYYIMGGALLVLLAVAFFLWNRWRRRKVSAEPVDLRPAWEIAFEKLAILRERKLIEEGKHKEFYLELTEIVRGYLGRMYDLTALDMTTTEFLDLLGELTLPDGLHDRVSKFLHHADLVKFARYVPDTARSQEEYQAAHDIVDIVRADYMQKQQTQLHLAEREPEEVAAGGGTT